MSHVTKCPKCRREGKLECRHMLDHVIVNLARHAPEGYVDEHADLTLYEQIKRLLKTIEYRRVDKGFSSHWINKLCRPLSEEEKTLLPLDLASAERTAVDLTSFLRTRKIWFVECYPKNSLPRLEAHIRELLLFPVADDCHLEIHFDNVKEVEK